MIKRLVVVSIVLVAIAGCKSYDPDNGWTRIEPAPGFAYYLYESDVPAVWHPDLFVTFPGYGGGYDNDVRNIIKKYLEKTNKPGIVIAPHTEHKDPAKREFSIEMTKKAISSIQHDRLFLLGTSAGAVLALSLSNEVHADKIVPIVAGAYKAAGGQPSDHLPTPGCSDVWFLNGYDMDVLQKYGILWDGTVFVDPAKRLADEIGAKMSLVPGLTHSTTIKLLEANDNVLDWLTE